jgi:hypothetical protein
MDDFKKRLVVEYKELSEKVEKLKSFLEGEKSEKFFEDEYLQANLLVIQLSNMLAYLQCLEVRMILLKISIIHQH